MKLFLSWSGPISHAVADVLHSWLPGVLPAVRPWLASEDIPKGSPWLSSVTDALKTADLGILCVVANNLDARWLNYEAGALAGTGAHPKVAPVLFGVSPSAVTGPLAQFQLTVFEREDFLRLLKSINCGLGDRALADATLERLFNASWPGLAQSVSGLIEPGESRSTDGPHDEKREEFDLDSHEEDVLAVLANLPEQADREWMDVHRRS